MRKRIQPGWEESSSKRKIVFRQLLDGISYSPGTNRKMRIDKTIYDEYKNDHLISNLLRLNKTFLNAPAPVLAHRHEASRRALPGNSVSKHQRTFSSNFCVPSRKPNSRNASFNEEEIRSIMQVSTSFAKRHRPRGCSKNIRMVTTQYLKQGLFSPIQRGSSRLETRADYRYQRSEAKGNQVCNLSSRNSHSKNQSFSSYFDNTCGNSLSPSKPKSKSKLSDSSAALHAEIQRVSKISEEYRNAIDEIISRQYTGSISEIIESRRKYHQIYGELNDEDQDALKMCRKHEKNLIHVRKMGGKPFIWKWSKFRVPKIVDNVARLLSEMSKQ